MAGELTTAAPFAEPGKTASAVVLRSAELVELSERVYRSIFRAGLWVALGTTGYAFVLVFVQIGPVDRVLAGVICAALAGALLTSARHHEQIYDALRRCPALAVLAAIALVAGHLAIGAASQVLFPPSLIVIGVLSAAVSTRWILLAALLVGAAQASPVFTEDLSALAARALITAAAADVFAPLLFGALLERLAQFMLDLQRIIDADPTSPVAPVRVRAWVRRPGKPVVEPVELEMPRPSSMHDSVVTARQRQVILLIGSGESYVAAAACLSISEGQVTKLLAQARERVGVTTTQQLVAWAIVTGLIPPPEPDDPGGPGAAPARHKVESA